MTLPSAAATIMLGSAGGVRLGSAEKRYRAQAKEHKKPEGPCRKQAGNDRKQHEKNQNPASFPKALEAHKKKPIFGGRKRLVKTLESTKEGSRLKPQYSGLGRSSTFN
jgi:hypothetical protein